MTIVRTTYRTTYRTTHPTTHRISHRPTARALLASASLLSALTAGAATPADLLAGYTAQAGAPAQAARGQAFFNSRHGKDWTCASCHGTAGPMLTGRMPGRGPDLVARNRGWLAGLLVVAVLGFWLGFGVLQWQTASNGSLLAAPGSSQHQGDDDDD